MKKFTYLPMLAALVVALLINSCQDHGTQFEDVVIDPEEDTTVSQFATGWNSENENPEEIPADINLGFGTGNLPGKVDLREYFPPIGNQGNYGTCTAWATAYNLKTALEAMDQGYSKSELSNPSRQFSPKDLFWSIPDGAKNANCKGVHFEPALDVMQQRGLATMQTVPYDGLGDCRQQATGGESEANNFKIANYRRINKSDPQIIKGYLAQKRPVVFGAYLADNFMNWYTDDVLTSHTFFNPNNQHGKHAMAIVGYDDSKGSGGAFQVINSWGADWGDFGYIWIDYSFFCSDAFCEVAFVATNQQSLNPDNPVDPTISGEVDLIPWGLLDVDDPTTNDETYRSLRYNIYNIGTEAATPDSRWSVIYVIYNAFNANENYVILHDYFTDEFGPGINQPFQGEGIWSSYWSNLTLPAQSGFAEIVFNGQSDHFFWNYRTPNVTGYYYLVCIADPFNRIQEADEANNYHFFHDGSGGPLYFQNGIVNGLQDDDVENRTHGLPQKGQKMEKPHQMDKKFANAYTPEEIISLIQYEQETGLLEEKVKAMGNKSRDSRRL
jgi:hypothetical protein